MFSVPFTSCTENFGCIDWQSERHSAAEVEHVLIIAERTWSPGWNYFNPVRDHISLYQVKVHKLL